MKYVFAAILLVSSISHAQNYVNGYVRSNGTYVAPHMRSAPDGNVNNNWSTRGNVNPYTGQAGTRNPDPYQGIHPHYGLENNGE